MPNHRGFDALDARIIRTLDRLPGASVLALSRELGIARNTVHARLSRLTDEGMLSPESTRLSAAALGYPLTAFVALSLSQNAADEAYERLGEMAQVVEVHSTTGDADLLARVVAKDTSDLHRVTRAMLELPGVTRTSTTVSLSEVVPYRLALILDDLAEG
ncbi:Lrp/AsnC family transcriptional regulator [Pseudoclavibacter sp. VKM Ac-2867]|uniref:Lrp/AsnC family transcriptional regulator n=1 Tax=Pseudoclavibacter sp. VKM Ac-2867 TaxID=2783829 RepID=UPI00188BEDE0|nr:Lrp/AsnC family transcriptional regulator [Pseudoclavibacter sp. VKM Ac-2867]MBF4458921.1 Lrp/AsnC family transcriptional regulator [Pseudoclavibacter sp. VKM Ac-2867]